MRFDPPLQAGRLERRYKRFLADVIDARGERLTLHCPNTGSMRNCSDPESRIWYWDSRSATRKYPCTWELVEVEGRFLACINTARANALVAEAIERGWIAELAGFDQIQREVRLPEGRSRIDLLLSRGDERCYVEVKNVTLLREAAAASETASGHGEGAGAFPDAVSERASKHLRELIALRQAGHRAVLLFCVAHTGIQSVRPADDIDPVYGQTLREARAAGVELLAYGATIDLESICLVRRLPVVL